jgi:hypothetical protein
MRFLVKATIPLEAGNDLVRDPEMASRMKAVMEDIKPESVYFTIGDGQRAMYLIVNMEDASDMVRIAEPLWLAFEADVDAVPVMTQEDVLRGTTRFQEMLEKY